MPTVNLVEDYPGIRRVCVAIEAEPPAGNSVVERAIARQDMAVLLAGLCGSPAFLELSLSTQRIANSEVILFPVGIDEPRILTLLVQRLADAVRRANSGRDGRRLRLKVAVHEGITTLVAGVFGGPAVRRASALVTTPALHTLLAAAPSAELAVLFSGRLRDDLGGFHRCLNPGDFMPVELPAAITAGATESGWLLNPDSVI